VERVTATYEGGLRFDVRVRDLVFTVDQTREDGGTGAGPMPSELLAGALAACMGMDVAYYCSKVGLDASGMSVEADLTTSDDKPYRAVEFRVRMIMPNTEIGKRHEALLRVAEKCYVHNSLAADPQVSVTISGRDETHD